MAMKPKTAEKRRAQSKAKKKAHNKAKNDLKHLNNMQEKQAQQQPVSFEFHKDATEVTIPINAWKTLVTCLKPFESLAMLFATVDQIGQQMVDKGDLLPVFFDDPEPIPGAVPDAQGRVQRKIKDSFWIRGTKKQTTIAETASLIETLGKPQIIMADGRTVYNSQDENQPEAVKPAEPATPAV